MHAVLTGYSVLAEYHAAVGTTTALYWYSTQGDPVGVQGGGGWNGAPVTLHSGCVPEAAAPGALGLK